MASALGNPTMPLKEKDLPNEVPSHVLQDDRHDFFRPTLTSRSCNFTEDDIKDKYGKAQQNVRLWQTWEAGSTEAYVKSKTASHDLPSDSSIKLILARTAYRAKVIKVLRERGT